MMFVCIRCTFLISLILFLSPVYSPIVAQADTTPPVTSAAPSPSNPNGLNSWYTVPVEMIFSSTDLETGVKSINWRLNSGTLNTYDFENTLNLAPNPSFEDSATPPITGWQFSGQPGSAGMSDSQFYKFDDSSAKIISSQNGWSGFRNINDYVPAIPFTNMNASVWAKTSGIAGQGVYFKIYALHPSGSTLISQTDPITTESSWQRVPKNFYVSVNDAYGVYLDLGIDGVGTVWFDGVYITGSLTDTSVTQTFSQNGSNTVEYYSKDNAENEELPHGNLSFKIDTVSPANWRNFSTSRAGNDHTLRVEITVDDAASGIDPESAFFQYSVDGGSTWGKYSTLTSCGSTWITDGWQPLSVGLENGGKTAELETPAVDFCNSNWTICKIVRFKINDLAGNNSVKDVCINGTWFSATGDVGSRNAIAASSASPSDNSDGVVFSAGSIDNFTTSTGWYVLNYLLPDFIPFDEWLAQFPPSGPLPSGKLPKVSGIFLNDGSFTVSGSTIPSGFSSSDFSAVVYVNGDLVVNSNFSLKSGSSLVFIVAGDIKIHKNVENVDAIFISDGTIDASYNGNSGEPLVVKGSFLADRVVFNRSLKGRENESDPAVEIIFQPQYLTSIPELLGESRLLWREVNP